MTRRERLERKQERRIDWAQSADAKSAAGFARAERIAKGIPFGHPILVGHHSERGHRADLKRIDSGMRAGCENSDKAETHRAKAAGLETALKNTIFSDDPDAIEAINAKADKLDREREQMKAANTAIRKHTKAGADAQRTALVALGFTETAAAGLLSPDFAGRIGFPSYALTNNSANARRLRQRIGQIQQREKQQQEAETNGGLLIKRSAENGYCSVTFAEFPGYDIVKEMKAAGFAWGGGSWNGYTNRLPESVKAMETA
mgnify:FL=1